MITYFHFFSALSFCMLFFGLVRITMTVSVTAMPQSLRLTKMNDFLMLVLNVDVLKVTLVTLLKPQLFLNLLEL